MSTTTKVCRPDKLTCRWVREMTEAIHVVCPSGPAPVLTCDKSNPEKSWSEYLQKLGQCVDHPTVRRMLEFELDYNDVRNKKQ